VAPAIVVVRGLAMMVRGRLMMSSGVMMVLARNVLLFGLVHGFSP
jgi:hypothetical protein